MLNLQSFRQWLEKNKNTIVGITFDHCHCPIAQYMLDVHGVRTSVDGNVIKDLDTAYVETMYTWSSRFVRWLDNENPRHIQVFGNAALKILDDSEAYWAKLAGEEGQ